MNDQKLWWSEVEERFRAHFPFVIIDWKLGEGNDGKATDKTKDILSFFHKEIQNRLHEEGKEEFEHCKNCRSLHSGSIIKVDVNNLCLFCGRKVGGSVDSELPK